MARTSSNMIELGTKCPDFKLMDTTSQSHVQLSDIRGKKGTVVMFICNHCPFVLHVNEELVRMVNDYRVLGFGFVGISSNDVENYPQDHPDLMSTHAEKYKYNFPYLYDPTQEVARAFDAACTPDFYLFDQNDQLVYRGQLDDSRPGNGIPLSGRSLREAMDTLLNNHSISPNQKPSIGCNIKWKSLD